MARRKRLGPAALTGGEADLPVPLAVLPGRASPTPPIAQVAGATAAEAALRELSDAFATARAEGRLVQALPLEAIEAGHLKRDRLAADAEEMSALKSSIAERGQQVPVDVVDLGQGRYGLISGWRRLQALRELGAETGEARFGEILAVLRRPAGAAEAYLSMVEENELRVGLSYYERAQVAARAAEAGVFADAPSAIAALFPTASKAKRSKIASFVRVHRELGEALRFPWEIGERLGLKLAQALAEGQGERLRAALDAAAARSAEAELAALTRALSPAKGSDTPNRVAHRTFPGGVELTRSARALKLSGPGVDEALAREIEAWLASRQAAARQGSA
jgi:ParB family transcriptional regulator, chromosome partitioning protein